MKKIFVFAVIVLMMTQAGSVLARPGQAGNFYGNATTYRVTVSKVETSQDSSTWITLGEGVQEFDIAAVNAGAQVGSYVSNRSIPAGTYRYMRITVSRTMIVNGTGATGGVTYYTTANTVNVGTGGALGLGSANQANQANATIIIPAEASSPDPRETVTISGNNLISTATLPEPFTVVEGGGTLSINFNTQRTIEFDVNDSALPNPAFYPRPPDISIEFQ